AGPQALVHFPRDAQPCARGLRFARFSRTGEENSRLSRRASFSLDAILAVACHPAFRSHRRGGGTHADEVWRAADAFVAEVAQPAAAALGAAAAARAG